MRELASLWIGKRLGELEIISIQSFLRQGHKLTVYSYEPVENLPEGVVGGDADQIMPRGNIVRYYKNNSPALHSDLFRYQMIRQTGALWVDLDIVAFRAFEFESEWVFGYEGPDEINGAVLGLPRDSGMLKLLSAYNADSRGVPPHLTGLGRAKYRLRNLIRFKQGGLHVSRWPWGSLGPRMLTYFGRITGEIDHALPKSAFYHIPMAETDAYLRPGALTMRDFPTEAYGTHFWGRAVRELLQNKYGGRIADGSFLDLAARGQLQ